MTRLWPRSPDWRFGLVLWVVAFACLIPFMWLAAMDGPAQLLSIPWALGSLAAWGLGYIWLMHSAEGSDGQKSSGGPISLDDRKDGQRSSGAHREHDEIGGEKPAKSQKKGGAPDP